MDRSINFSKPSYDRNKSRRGLVTSFLLIIFFYVAIFISLPARAVPPPSSPPVVIDFENLTTGGPGGAGTLVAVFRQFVDPSASRGVIFNGPKAIDYSLGPFAIPDFAHSGSRAIEACVGQEFCTLPIEMTFTAAQTMVKVMAGYSAPLTQASAVVLRAFDSAGTMVGTASATLNASTSPQSIQLPLEVSTPNPSIVRVTVSLSAGTPTLNNHLAIDDVEFDIPGPPPPCVAAQAPILSLTSPVAGETEYSNEFLFQGAVNTADQLTLATLNVQQFGPAPPTFLDLLSSGVVSSNGGNFAERLDGLLIPGNNIVSFQAQNCRGLADGIDLQVFYFVPSPPRVLGAEINQGLPTYPLVAGKSTLALWLLAFVFVTFGRVLARAFIARTVASERCMVVGDHERVAHVRRKLHAVFEHRHFLNGTLHRGSAFVIRADRAFMFNAPRGHTRRQPASPGAGSAAQCRRGCPGPNRRPSRGRPRRRRCSRW